MEIQKAKDLCRDLMRKHGLHYWRIVISNTKVVHGSYHYFKHVITLSRHFITLNTEDVVKNTILHEIAHALTPGAHHSKVWKQKAMEIGCDPDMQKKVQFAYVESKYKFKCSFCGHIVGAHRNRKRQYAHKACCDKFSNGKFDSRFLLVEVK